MLKKVIAMVCAAMLVVGMAVPAFAAEVIVESPGSIQKVLEGDITLGVNEGVLKTVKEFKISDDFTLNDDTKQIFYDALESNDIISEMAKIGIIVTKHTANLLNGLKITRCPFTEVEPTKANGKVKLSYESGENYDYALMLVITDNGVELLPYGFESGNTAIVDGGVLFGLGTKTTA